MTPKTPRNGQKGRVLALKHRTPEGTIIYDIGPWPSAKQTKPTQDAPAVNTPPSAPVYAQVLAEHAEYLPPIFLPPDTKPAVPAAVSTPPSPLEQSLAELGQAKDDIADAYKNSSSIATIGTYTTAGLVTGIGFGALAYNLMDNPRSVSASLLIGGICTIAGVVLGVYQAQKAEHQQRN